ncbi:hypothetical protein Tco_0530592 [Tanacetum coccineum]
MNAASQVQTSSAFRAGFLSTTNPCVLGVVEIFGVPFNTLADIENLMNDIEMGKYEVVWSAMTCEQHQDVMDAIFTKWKVLMAENPSELNDKTVGNTTEVTTNDDTTHVDNSPIVTVASNKEGNITMSNSYIAFDDESEEDVENVYDESTNLLLSTQTDESSSTFTVAVGRKCSRTDLAKSPGTEFAKSLGAEFTKSSGNEFEKSSGIEFVKSSGIEFAKSPETKFLANFHFRDCLRKTLVQGLFLQYFSLGIVFAKLQFNDCLCKTSVHGLVFAKL